MDQAEKLDGEGTAAGETSGVFFFPSVNPSRNNVDGHQSRQCIFEVIKHESFFLSLNMLLPDEVFFHIFMAAVCLCSPLFISQSVFDVLRNAASGNSVFSETFGRK